MTKPYIWLDMDGTIADLYGVRSWLSYIILEDVTPFKAAAPLYNIKELLQVLNQLKNTFNIGIISWLPKNGRPVYNKKVAKAKINWLKKHKLYSLLDNIQIVEYNTNKAEVCQSIGRGYLVDDDNRNLNQWFLGNVIDAKGNIITELIKLI